MATDKKQTQTEVTPPHLDLMQIPLKEPKEGVFDAYANVVHMDWTLYDLRIRFGELTQFPNQDSPTWKHQQSAVLERATIRLGWNVAKAVRDLLDGVIRSYEKVNGEITQPKLAPPPTLSQLPDRK